MIVDLHSHILPGIDDGSPDVETSLTMLHLQTEQGVGVVCATPHFYAEKNSIDRFCERRAAAFKQLEAAGAAKMPRLLLGTEIAFFSGISRCPELERLCIQGTRTLLLELPFMEWSQFQMEEVAALTLDQGYRVILVHPERFCAVAVNRERLRQLSRLPLALQVNARTLMRWSTRRLGLELFRETSCPLLASDCHNLTSRPPNLAEARKVLQQKMGEDLLAQIDKNAADVLGAAAEKVVP